MSEGITRRSVCCGVYVSVHGVLRVIGFSKKVSCNAVKRGREQSHTDGSGRHFGAPALWPAALYTNHAATRTPSRVPKGISTPRSGAAKFSALRSGFRTNRICPAWSGGRGDVAMASLPSPLQCSFHRPGETWAGRRVEKREGKLAIQPSDTGHADPGIMPPGPNGHHFPTIFYFSAHL